MTCLGVGGVSSNQKMLLHCLRLRPLSDVHPGTEVRGSTERLAVAMDASAAIACRSWTLASESKLYGRPSAVAL